MGVAASSRAREIKYAIRNVARVAKQLEEKGKKILYCNIGDPLKFDFSTPKHMIGAVSKAMEQGHNYYAFSSGVQEAREAIAEEAKKKGFKNLTYQHVTISDGVSEGIEIVLQSMLNFEDNILVPVPTYPVYTAIVNKIGCGFVPYYLNEEDGWQPDLEDMKKNINAHTKAIVVNNPNNPTGGVYSKAILKEVIHVAAQHKLAIISDEIYDRILFDQTFYPMATLTDEVPIVTFNGLSKNYLVPGWRIGWMILSNIDLDSGFAKCINNMVDARLSSPTPPQFAIKPALEGSQDHIANMNAKLRKRRDLLYKRLNEISGLSCTKPEGAFYAFPKITVDIKNDEQFVLDLLKETGVLFVHGSGFGQRDGTFHCRVVFLPPENILEEAFEKLEAFMKKYQ